MQGVAVSITTAANWTGNFIIALVTPILLNSVLRTFGTFYLLAGLLVLATLFVLLCLPETKVHNFITASNSIVLSTGISGAFVGYNMEENSGWGQGILND